MKRDDIRYLRFIAITSVLCSFTWPEIFPNSHLGGSLFFVLSGYLLCHAFKEKTEVSFTETLNFYFKRARRALPIYLITLTVILIFLYASISREDIHSIIKVKDACIFLSFISGHKNERMQNAFYHCWAFTVHLIFAFFFPIFVNFLNKFNFITKNGTNILLMIICLNLFLLPHVNIDSFFGRFWQFLIGVIAYRNPIPKKYSFFFVFFASFISLSIIPFIPDRILFPLDILIITLSGIILAFEDSFYYNEEPYIIVKIIYHISDISLILYLISWPLANYCKYIFKVSTISVPSCGIIAGSILISTFLHSLAEIPLFKFCNSPKRLISVSAILYAALILLLIALTSSFFVSLKF